MLFCLKDHSSTCWIRLSAKEQSQLILRNDFRGFSWKFVFSTYKTVRETILNRLLRVWKNFNYKSVHKIVWWNNSKAFFLEKLQILTEAFSTFRLFWFHSFLSTRTYPLPLTLLSIKEEPWDPLCIMEQLSQHCGSRMNQLTKEWKKKYTFFFIKRWISCFVPKALSNLDSSKPYISQAYKMFLVLNC